ncbi:hypothetical protein [Hymenobacter sp. GOD-10R]|uniref:hypothetical protein n=1 Tax=Hymenobacter sp. GOD-10R TaxID=3093922 RepID=UPI002D769EE3|nr:hypothetical protein [Hymenobacter sp. GOD-10R]WRQ26226.1 hypothetical protein SD425_14175 [Hymenobacter sp. GOD-10R]
MSPRLVLIVGGLVFGLTVSATAQTITTVSKDSVAALVATRSVMLKLGTGLTRGFAFGSGGLALPVVPGFELQFSRRWSLYASGFSGIYLFGEERNSFRPERPIGLNSLGYDVGVRHYYNQQKRQQHGRATGPFVGNYLALQTASCWWYKRDYRGYNYEYTSITALWGMQRRLGGHGLLDAYAGLGLWNAQVLADATIQHFWPVPELGLKLSFVH